VVVAEAEDPTTLTSKDITGHDLQALGIKTMHYTHTKHALRAPR